MGSSWSTPVLLNWAEEPEAEAEHSSAGSAELVEPVVGDGSEEHAHAFRLPETPFGH